MPLALLKYAIQREYKGERYFPAAEPLRDTYDVVIIGGDGRSAIGIGDVFDETIDPLLRIPSIC